MRPLVVAARVRVRPLRVVPVVSRPAAQGKLTVVTVVLAGLRAGPVVSGLQAPHPVAAVAVAGQGTTRTGPVVAVPVVR